MKAVNHILSILIIIVLSTTLFFTALNKASLWDMDEPHNAECSREMLERHDFIVPTFNYELRGDKPVLIYWFMELAYKIFGVNEFSARFFSPIFGIGTILLVYLFGCQVFDFKTGHWAALILITILLFNVSVRIATPDAMLIFFINLAIFSFYLGYFKKQPLYFYLFYVAMALAVLSKGPMGIVLPLGVVFFFILLKRDIGILKEMRLKQGIIIFFLLAIPWYVLVSIKTNGEFFSEFVMKHNIYRYLNVMQGHRGPFFYYLLVLPLGLFPWGGLLPFLPFHSYKKITDVQIFLWIWIVLFIVFFSFAHTKLPTYINPIFPSISLLLAHYVCYGELKKWPLNIFLGFNGLFGLLLLLPGGAALAYFYPRLCWIALMGFIPLLGWRLGLLFYRRGWLRASLLMQFLVGYLLIFFIINWATPAVDRCKITKPFALMMKEKAKPHEPIICHRYFQPSLVFYTQRKIEKIDDISQLIARLERCSIAFIVTRASQVEILKHHFPKLSILSCKDGFYVRDKICLLKLK